MSIVTSVHLKVVRCHRFKKKHHMRLLLKVFADLEKLFSLKWRCPPREAFHWWRGECSADPAGRPIMKCSVGVSLVLKNPGRAPKMKGCCWITQRRWDSWPPEEKNSIRGQRRGLIAQSFCVINFYESIKEIEKADIDIRRGRKSTPGLFLHSCHSWTSSAHFFLLPSAWYTFLSHDKIHFRVLLRCHFLKEAFLTALSKIASQKQNLKCSLTLP